MVNGKIIAAIIISVLILLGAYFFVSISNVTQSGNSVKILGTGSSVIENEKIIKMTPDGFSPSTLTISAGNTVKFVNEDTVPHWPASGMHPTHTNYAGANYSEEGSYDGSLACKAEGQPKDGAFDPCKAILAGESWSFTFYEKGSWGFHDHLNARMTGEIVVE